MYSYVRGQSVNVFCEMSRIVTLRGCFAAVHLHQAHNQVSTAHNKSWPYCCMSLLEVIAAVCNLLSCCLFCIYGVFGEVVYGTAYTQLLVTRMPSRIVVLHFAEYKNICRFTYSNIGDKEVPGLNQGEKLGFTVMVSSTAAGEMVPFLAITSGGTDRSLKKFVEGNGFGPVQGGFVPEGRGQRYAYENGHLKASERPGGVQFAAVLPHFVHEEGHIICTGVCSC